MDSDSIPFRSFIDFALILIFLTLLSSWYDQKSFYVCQSGQLFYVGVPTTYCLPPMDQTLPHLPSYESVRKKDRQRQIHMMIADRFGLNGPATTEVRPFDQTCLQKRCSPLR